MRGLGVVQDPSLPWRWRRKLVMLDLDDELLQRLPVAVPPAQLIGRRVAVVEAANRCQPRDIAGGLQLVDDVLVESAIGVAEMARHLAVYIVGDVVARAVDFAVKLHEADVVELRMRAGM